MAKGKIMIEFMGLPSSGKTTLANELSETLRNRGFEVKTPVDKIANIKRQYRILIKIYYLFLEIIFHPKWVVFDIIKIIKSRQRSITDFLKVTLNYFFVAHISRKYSRKGSLTIIDQGVFQAIWSIYISSRLDHENFMQLDFNIPVSSDVLVWVKVDREEVLQRLKIRKNNKSRMGKALQDNSYPKISEGDEIYKLLIDEYKDEIPHILRLENNNLKQKNKNLQEILELLIQID